MHSWEYKQSCLGKRKLQGFHVVWTRILQASASGTLNGNLFAAPEKALLDKYLCVLSCISASLAKKKVIAKVIVVVFGLLIMEKDFCVVLFIFVLQR